ncbi:protein phosphatase 2C domain-containing protein [Streptomyces luomodiensis]|uniref:Protein phosphatase 2C domain-containing protein n=1 Tax=Streptomyces luomodiensis TaxID=3026192 RepID=A0ABY9V4D7_9ACTN|nr:protein phosphatase 2C domain-containing protein [Streptomyces sp. SCA4-21]WNE99476.1 protein phosphatase 2C domain-containing protein [Streptomyces sp. SCA4-21]
MSQQGDRRGQEDDWWAELYDPRRSDAGPAAASDSVDDRFDSASRTLTGDGDAGDRRPAAGAPWGPWAGQPGGAAPGSDAGAGGGPQGWRSPGGEGPGAAPPSREGTARDGNFGAGPALGGIAASGAGAAPDRTAKSRVAPAGTEPGAAWDGADPGATAERTEPGTAPGRADSPAPSSPPPPPTRAAGPPASPRPTPKPEPSRPAEPSRPWRTAAASYVGDEPPTYEAEPTTLPVADPEDLRDLVPDTVLEGARYGTLTLRAASLRGAAARYRGEPRRDALLAARFGTGDSALVLVALASGPRAAPGAHRAARELCEWIAGAVGRNRIRLTEDIHTANRGALSAGLHRLTGRAYGRLRAGAAVRGLAAADCTASVRCLLLPAHPACRTRVFFGVGDGGLFRLRGGVWQDLEPAGDTPAPTEPEPEQPEHRADPDPDHAPAPGPFRFRTSVARPGDTLLLCGAGLAEPLRGEAALADHLAARWGAAEPPGLAAFLADTQTGVKGYADDRTAAAVWEA